jgi:hypothetical protein
VRSDNPLNVIERIRSTRVTGGDVERCELCASPVAVEHSHLVDLHKRRLVCCCDACVSLFDVPLTRESQEISRTRFKRVPTRWKKLGDVVMGRELAAELCLPVGLIFLMCASPSGKAIALFPGPIGVAEADISGDGWARVVERWSALQEMVADVEAIMLVNMHNIDEAGVYLVPIDACFNLAGRLQTSWKGLDGGIDGERALADFVREVSAKSGG